MTRRRLPLGIQTFRKVREDGCYYVDKTPWIGELLDRGNYYFLSRPRRFGKSLLLDTLKELFEGNEPLFRGLAIHDRWDWSARVAVLVDEYDKPILDTLDRVENIRRVAEVARLMDQQSLRTARSA